MKLSIIMPTYNSEEYLEQAIISVQRQITKNIELIIINDGSEDHTEKICKMYKSKYIHYVEIEHSGAGCARNIGINMAEGEWISFLDSDDLYLSRRLNDEFIEILDESLRAGIDIISTPRLKTDMYLQYEPKETPAQKIYMIRNHMPKLEFWTCIYKKSFLLTNKIKFYEYVKQDIESAFRYLAFSRTNKIRVCNNMPFYLQRNNPKSNTHTWDRYCLNEIKSEVYIDLLKQTLLEQDKPFLAQVALEQIDSYYTMCLADGYNSVGGGLIECKKMYLN